MGVLPIVLFFFFISGISAAEFSLEVIEELYNKSVKSVHFDEKGNTYVFASSRDSDYDRFRTLSTSGASGAFVDVFSSFNFPEFPDSLYELNVTHGLIYSKNLAQILSEMHVSTRGDVYYRVNKTFEFQPDFMVKPSGSAEFHDIRGMIKLVHLDNDGNLFYLREFDNFIRIFLLPFNSTSPNYVENLLLYKGSFTLTTAFDNSGNLYVGGVYLPEIPGMDPSVVLISKEAFKDENPRAQAIYNPEFPQKIAQDLMVDGENNLWLATVKDDAPKESSIMKFKNGTLETLLTKENTSFLKLVSSNDKTYVTELTDGEENSNSTIYTIFTIGANGEVVEIPELKNISLEAEPKVVADKEGQAYVYTSNGEELPSLGVMATMKSNETKPIPIAFETSKKKIDSVKFDFDNRMWMVADSVNIYFLEKGATVPVLVKTCSGSHANVNVNFVTRRVYIGCPNGLFLVVESQSQGV